MSTIQDTDQFLVQRGQNSLKQSAKDLMSTINADTAPYDYLLIQRGTDSFKVSAKDVKDQLGGGAPAAPVLDSVTLSQDGSPDGNRFTSKSFTSTTANSGGAATTLEMTGTVTGALGLKAGSDPIQSNPYTGTGAGTSVALTLTGNTNLDQSDGIEEGDTVTANVSYTPETSNITSRTNLVKYSEQDRTGEPTPYRGSYQILFDGDQSGADTSWGAGTDWVTLATVAFTGTKLEFKMTSGNDFKVRFDRDPNTDITFTGADNAWATVPTPATFTTVQTSGLGQAYGMFGIKVNNILLADSQVTNGTILSFPTEKDIKLFQVDDVVQEENAPWNNNTTWSETIVAADQSGNPIDAFELKRAFDSDITNTARAVSTFTLDNIGITNVTKLEIYITCAAQNITVDINDNGGETISHSGGYAHITPTLPSTSVDKIEFALAVSSCDLLYIRCTTSDKGLRYLMDPGETQPGTTEVKVTATDVSAKTITVDGGDWDASNQSQVWSANSSFTAGSLQAGSLANAFDGNDSTVVESTQNGTWEVTFDPPLSGEISVKNNAATTDRTWHVYVGVTDNAVNSSGSVGYQSLGTFSGVTKITQTSAGLYGTSVSAIKVGGSLLVDPVLDSQVWSSQVTGTAYGTNVNVGPFTNLFDGDPTTYTAARADSWCGWIPPSNSTYEVHFTKDSGAQSLEINGQPYNGSSPATGNNLTSVRWNTNAANQWVRVSMIKLDGKLVLDPGIRDLGDNKVSTVSPKQGSGTVSNISGNVVTVSPYTDNCFKEGQWLTVNKTINVTPKTDPIASYTPGTKTLTFDGPKDLMQFANGDAVTMVNADGSAATYNAETSAITNVSTATVPDSDASDSVDNFNTITQWNQEKYKMWDGSTTTYAACRQQNNLTFTITFTDFTGLVNPAIYLSSGSGSSLSTITVTTDVGSQNFSVKGPVRCQLDSAATQIISIRNTPTDVGAGQQMHVYAVESDGVILSDQYKVLTFTNNDNLQYYKNGDVVKTETAPITDVMTQAGAGSTGTHAVWKDAFDGNTSTKSQSGNYTWIFKTPLTGNLGIWASSSQSHSPGNGGVDYLTDGVWNWMDLSDSKDGVPRFYNLPSPIEGIRIKLSSSYNYGQVAGIVLDSSQPNTSLLTYVEEDVDIKAVGDPTLDPPQMTVNGGTWANGDTITKSMSGTGTVDSTNPLTNTMVLSGSNDEWVDDYYVTTSSKPAVVTTAYLKFSADGAVTGYQATPVDPRVMNNITNPKLTFPAKFTDTDTAPDTEFPGTQTYIQTSVQLKNSAGNSAVVASNALVPQTNIRSIGPGEVESNADDVRAMGMQIATHDQRVADHTAAKRQQAIADFEANLRRYTP